MKMLSVMVMDTDVETPSSYGPIAEPLKNGRTFGGFEENVREVVAMTSTLSYEF
jgi:hypothetical protein